MTVVIDQTHMGRRASGIERITAALVSKEALAPLPVELETTKAGRLGILLKQAIAMPAHAARRRDTVWVFPGFPPSPAFAWSAPRVVPYIHDLFLIDRPQDLNLAARRWFAPNFARALRTYRLFLANTETTALELRKYVHADAEILVYRPPAANVFGLKSQGRAAVMGRPIVLGAIGTLEPRKNFPAAAQIAKAVARRLDRAVELHIIGRSGWGGVQDTLQRLPGVTLHGFLSDSRARAAIEQFDALICTSHAEGLCLPLLECQFAGLPIVAPDQPVFREVLGKSGIHIDPSDAEGSAAAMIEVLSSPPSRVRSRSEALANIDRWNALAEADRQMVVARLAKLLSDEART